MLPKRQQNRVRKKSRLWVAGVHDAALTGFSLFKTVTVVIYERLKFSLEIGKVPAPTPSSQHTSKSSKNIYTDQDDLHVLQLQV